jgi:putative transposase
MTNSGPEGSFIRSQKPAENGYVESFNGKLRDECLNTNQFLSINDARCKIEAWRIDYNELRPRSALGHRSPKEYLRESTTEGQKIAFFQH